MNFQQHALIIKLFQLIFIEFELLIYIRDLHARRSLWLLFALFSGCVWVRDPYRVYEFDLAGFLYSMVVCIRLEGHLIVDIKVEGQALDFEQLADMEILAIDFFGPARVRLEVYRVHFYAEFHDFSAGEMEDINKLNILELDGNFLGYTIHQFIEEATTFFGVLLLKMAFDNIVELLESFLFDLLENCLLFKG